MIKAKEFIEGATQGSYKSSGQTYYKVAEGEKDLDEKMNDFFDKNPEIEIIKVTYISSKRRFSELGSSVVVNSALLLYRTK